jgi:2-methylisocitrate lyase-like PEP mutase family enzyme
MAGDTGIAGVSIEDSTGNRNDPLFPLDVGVERMKAARRAIDAAGGDTLLVGRAECFIVGVPDLDEAIRRLKAYSEAGADCLYAPGIRTREQITAVVDAVAPKPVNVLVGTAGELTVADLAAMGVRRISLGGGLARVAWTAIASAATQLAENGSFAGFASGPPNPTWCALRTVVRLAFENTPRIPQSRVEPLMIDTD